MNYNSNRQKIIKDFAMWTALSSTRSNCPIKSAKHIYPLLRNRFDKILEGDAIISPEDFKSWHKQNVMDLTKEIFEGKDCKLSTIWAAKIINVYLKASVYIGGLGNPELINFIHPPIDTKLLQGIKDNFKEEVEGKIAKYKKMTDIKDYDDYNEVISFMINLTKGQYPLIEVEKFWKETEPK